MEKMHCYDDLGHAKKMSDKIQYLFYVFSTTLSVACASSVIPKYSDKVVDLL